MDTRIRWTGRRSMRGHRTPELAGRIKHGIRSVVAGTRRPSVAVERVSYHGISVSVPRAWPVYRLGDDPTRCVLFDRHAVYLGTPGPNEACPAGAAGQTSAVLVEPLGASGAARAMAQLRPTVVDNRVVGVGVRSALQPGYTMVSPQAHAEVVVTSGADRAVADAIAASIRIHPAPAGQSSMSIAGPTAAPTAAPAVLGTKANAVRAGTAAGGSIYTGFAF